MTADELERFRNSVEARLEMWDAQVRLLEAHVHGFDVPYTERMVRTLRRKWHALRCTIQALKTAGDDVWEDVEGFVSYAFADLQRSLDRIREHAEEQAAVEN